MAEATAGTACAPIWAISAIALCSGASETRISPVKGLQLALLQKKREIFREQHGLIDDDLSTGDLEFAIRASQYIFSAACDEIGFGFQPVSVDDKMRFH
jgi:hypothetical protein